MPTQSILDTGGSNPFWPKNMPQPGGPDAPAANKIDFTNVAFGVDPADVTVNVATTPADQAWSVNWGDGGADQPVAAATNNATHHYADKSPGKQYTIKVTSGTDSDSRNLQY
jgi:hypothetical protein